MLRCRLNHQRKKTSVCMAGGAVGKMGRVVREKNI